MTQVFYAYATADARQRDQLEKQLKSLKQRGIVDGWFARAVGPGSGWRDEVSPKLEQSEIILLLVSRDFVSSDYAYSTELRAALERQRRGEARVIPVLLRPCNWKGLPYSTLAPLPADGEPVSRWSNADQAFEAIGASIATVIARRNGTAVPTTTRPRRTFSEDSPTSTEAPEAPEAGQSAPAPHAEPPAAPASASAPSAAETAAAWLASGDPAPAQVALQPGELGPSFRPVETPATKDGAAQTRFTSVARAESHRVAQLVYKEESPQIAAARLEAAVRGEVAKGAHVDTAPDGAQWGASGVRRVHTNGKSTPSVGVFAAKGRFLVAAKVIGADPAGEGGELAESVVRRMLARIPG